MSMTWSEATHILMIDRPALSRFRKSLIEKEVFNPDTGILDEVVLAFLDKKGTAVSREIDKNDERWKRLGLHRELEASES